MVVLNKCKYLIREEKKGGGRWKERREREGRKEKRGRQGGGERTEPPQGLKKSLLV